MADYIKRAEAENSIYATDISWGATLTEIEQHRKALREIPASPVIERQCAKLILEDETGLWICSRCFSGKPTQSYMDRIDSAEVRYCYYCGAKLEVDNG